MDDHKRAEIVWEKTGKLVIDRVAALIDYQCSNTVIYQVISQICHQIHSPEPASFHVIRTLSTDNSEPSLSAKNAGAVRDVYEGVVPFGLTKAK